MHRSKRTQTLITLLKIILAVAILSYLIVLIQRQDGFTRLRDGTKHWGLLLGAAGLVTTGFTLSFVRWYLLVRALKLNFHLRDAFRLGSLGYLLNFISPGSVGGDLFKAVFLAREQPERKTAAVASILIDRTVGLYAMLLVACLGIYQLEGSLSQDLALQTIAKLIQIAALIGTVSLVLLMFPGTTGKRIQSLFARLPMVGETCVHLIQAAAAYRHHRLILFSAILIAGVTHLLIVSAFWAIERGLPVESATFQENLVLVPTSLLAGVIPATPSGLGTMEAAVELLYRATGAIEGDGTIVALAYRMATLVMASVGAMYYLTARKRVGDLIHQADELADDMG
jgi:uncharacterized protein (TIRG00374 family)